MMFKNIFSYSNDYHYLYTSFKYILFIYCLFNMLYILYFCHILTIGLLKLCLSTLSAGSRNLL